MNSTRHSSSAPTLVEFDEKRIDSLFTSINQSSLPGAAVGIAVNGTPVYRKGFGLANMELSPTLTPNTRMRIFSISKHFTALAYLLLCENGDATLDTQVGTYFPNMPRCVRESTPRQLMGHISGLHDVFDICWHFSGTGWRVPSTEILALYEKLNETNFPPETSWSYNNGGWLMVSRIIEVISGATLEDFLSERIFKPIGMMDSLLRRFDIDFVPNSATLHMTGVTGSYEKSYLGGALAGEGGIVSTVDDMLRWLRHMTQPTVGSAATWELMMTPQRLRNGTSTRYGLGLFNENYRGTNVQYHAGGGMGGNSYMIRVPDARLDIVVIVNRQDVWASNLADAVLNACLPAVSASIPPRESSKNTATGVFFSQKMERVVELSTDSGHQTMSVNGMDLPSEFCEDGWLRPTEGFRNIQQAVWLLGDSSYPESVQLQEYGHSEILPRQAASNSREIEEILGQYRWDSLSTEALIYKTEDGLQFKVLGCFGSVSHRLQCLAPRIWRARLPSSPWISGILFFSPDYSNFRFSSHRTHSLQFNRIC